MNTSSIVSALRECQTEKLIAVNQPYPVSFNIRVVNSQRESRTLRKILDASKRSGGIYKVKLLDVA